METEKNSCGQFGAGDEHKTDSKRNTGFKRRLSRNAAGESIAAEPRGGAKCI